MRRERVLDSRERGSYKGCACAIRKYCFKKLVEHVGVSCNGARRAPESEVSVAGSVNRRAFTRAILAGLGAAAIPPSAAGAAPRAAAAAQSGAAKQLRIGCTSLVWGVFPRAGDALETAVRDMSELGYNGFETFGQVLEDWDRKGTLERLIAEHKIPLISAYAPLNVIDPSVRKAEIDTIVRWGKILRKHGGQFLVIEAGGAKRASYDFAAHRSNIVASLNDYGRAMADVGVGSGLHQHTGTAIETRDEVYAVMESVDTRIFKFAPDVGQLQKGGADAAQVVKDFASITVHMHLKDFVNGPHMGGYSPLGIGRVDLKAILETLEQANPKANIMHELDPSKNMPYTPRQTAEISKWYLQKLGYMQGADGPR
jgi:inosose dehydratase